MKIQWENAVMSSLMLHLDHTICGVGEGYTNHSGAFYKTQTKFNQLYSYSLPYKQIISDSSVFGADIMEGVYIDGQFKTVGEAGFQGILHHKGTVLFDQNYDASSITGNFSVKEYNIYITTKAEESQNSQDEGEKIS